jgi:hypothetical protein
LEGGADVIRVVDCVVLQGAELMGKYGINVPRGAAAGSVQELKDVLNNTFPNEKEVTTHGFPILCYYHNARCTGDARLECSLL